MWTYNVLFLGIGLGMFTLVAAVFALFMEAAEGAAGEGRNDGDTGEMSRRGKRRARAPRMLFYIGVYLYWITAGLLAVWGGVAPLRPFP